MLWYLGIAAVTLFIGTLVALLFYGRFVERALGEPGSALAPQDSAAPLDRILAPLEQAHPGHSGLLLVEDSTDAFAMRALSARDAQRSIDVQYYIWHNDHTGRLLAQELVRAADRGIRVRVLFDDINARGKDDVIFALDSHPYIEVRLFNPGRNREGILGRAVELLLRGFMLNRRMHNKAWIVDGRVALVGGRNVGDEYFDHGAQVNFHDMDLLVAGPAVAQTSAIFDQFWNSRAVIPITALHRIPLKRRTLTQVRLALDETEAQPGQMQHLYPAASKPAQQGEAHWLQEASQRLLWSERVQVLSDPPEKAHPRSASQLREQWLMHALNPLLQGASEELIVLSPYFVPGERGTQRLLDKAGAGVQTRVLTNSLASTDVALVHAGYSRYREPLLAGGIILHELMPAGPQRLGVFGSSQASLHTKAMVADGARGFVGSFNVDPRSAELNTEMGVLFEDARLAAQVRESYLQSIGPDSAYRLTLEQGEVRWHEAGKVWDHEPQAQAWKRALLVVMRWLPIESQL